MKAKSPPNMPVLPGVTPSPVGDGTVQGFQPEGYFAIKKDDICRPLICCGDDDPVPNYTSDSAPHDSYITVDFGDSWSASNCVAHYISYISQADADAQAAALVVDCESSGGGGGGQGGGGGGGSGSSYCNDEVSCADACTGGGYFYHTVPAGLYCSTSKANANAAATRLCQLAISAYKFCITGIYDGGCVGSAYSDTVLVTPMKAGLSSSIVSGSLPPGLALGPVNIDGTIEVSGTPTTSGTYTFTLQVQDIAGNYVLRIFSISILEITGTPPDGTVGSAYSYQMTASGGSGNYAWSINSGSLPDGLSMDGAGLITGTPTVAAGFDATFCIVDLG